MEKMDDKPIEGEEFKTLHEAIEEGNLELVRQIVESHGQERHFTYDDTSALYKAFESKKYEMISFLIYKRATFVGSENDYVYYFDIDLDRLNYLLFEYNKRSDKSCVYKLMSLSQSPQDMDGDRLKALMSMYEYFFESEIIKSLLNILESVDFDIVIDFESDKVNMVHRLDNQEAEIFGLTLSIVREIFVGGKDLLSGDPKKTAKVYGVVAEELCHLALTTVFQNDAKPYKEEDSKSIHKFNAIVRDVKSLVDRSSQIESVIQDVFGYYNGNSWECELIARVPHVIGIYGEESGKGIFKESSELSRLLDFYEQNVLPKCKEYMDPLLKTKSDRIMKQLIGKNEFISFKEKQIRPLKENFPLFRDYVVVEQGVSVISTNCTKLCTLHVYYELKIVYGDQLDKKCLFFGSECFEKKRGEILNALKCKLCEYLVLVVEDKELHHRRLLCEYLDHFEGFEGMNIIVISNSQFLGHKFQKKAVEYKWDDFTDEYKDFLTQPMEYIFKGEKKYLFIKKENVPELFSENILTIISGDLIEVQDIADCQGYNHETYIKREFQATIIDRNIFERLPNDTSFLIYGLSYWDIEELSSSKSKVQWLKGPNDGIQKGKAIFINDKERPMSFEDFVGKTAAENSICLRYDRKVFYLMKSKGDVCQHYTKKIRQTEGEIIDLLKSNKTLIISENAGCGKSTVMSRLIWHVKNKMYNSWILTVDLNKFSIKDDGPDSEENDEEEMFEDVFEMLGFENGIEKFLFRDNYNQENYFIYLDAFDEIPSNYKTKALKLISFLRRKTDARIMITTRLHHQQELEEILNAFSHRLVPFDNSEQVSCLGRMWRWKLKFPDGGRKHPQKEKKAISRKIESIIGELEKEKTNSESLIVALREIKLEDSVDLIRGKIDGLEFNRLANDILNKTCLDEEALEFMGIPLHLFMVGIIYFDGNFNVEINSDIYGIYSEFIDQKVRIYVEEKQGVSHDGRVKRKAIEKGKEDAYRIHIRLANLMDEGKLNVKMDEEDLELCASLGIVFINGGEVDFLHYTFAEYFKAESIRMNFDKKSFTDVLFEDKYDVVRRFITSALEKEKFENLTEEFFEDMNFLVDVLRRFVDKFYDFCLYPYSVELNRRRSYKPNSVAPSVAKIVRCLLKIFENTVDANLANKFALKLKMLLSLRDGQLTGGCLTVKMLKSLFHGNFEANFRMMFGAVRYYSNPHDVVFLLNECISIQTAGDCDETVKCLLKLLKVEDSKGRCLLYWAICNEDVEIFASVLKFSRDVLGKERFVNEIVQSTEYRDAMEKFTILFFSRVKGLLKAFHSVFDDEIKILFDAHLKFCILQNTLRLREEFRDPFEEVVNLFVECFGTEELKQLLLSCDSKDRYLIHSLVSKKSKVAKKLNFISNILGDKKKMKQFVKGKDRNWRNMFHIAAKNEYIDFADVLPFCIDVLGQSEFEEMILSTDEDGENVLHLLFKNNSTETLKKNINLIKDALADEKKFKDFLKRKDKDLKNIFHFAAKNGSKINISFLDSHLHKSEIKHLLIERSKVDHTCLHSGANTRSKNLPALLDYVHEIDKNQFELLILARDEEGNTFLHLLVREYIVFDEESKEELMDLVNSIIKSLREKVSDDLFNKLLGIRNEEGKTFPQMKGVNSNEKIVVECFERILGKKLVDEPSNRNDNCTIQ